MDIGAVRGADASFASGSRAASPAATVTPTGGETGARSAKASTETSRPADPFGAATTFEPSATPSPAPKRSADVQSTIQRNVTIDQDSRQVVFQSIDSRTGTVVRQFPDEHALKLKAYYREEADKQAASKPEPSLDQRV